MPINNIKGITSNIVKDDRYTAKVTPTASLVANQYFISSVWQTDVVNPGTFPTSGTSRQCDSSTVGAIKLPTLTSGQVLRLLYAQADSGISATASSTPVGRNLEIWLCDRLVDFYGIDGTITTTQAVNTTSLPRHTDGIGVHLALESYDSTGNMAASTLTFTIKDETNTTRTITHNNTYASSACTTGTNFIIPNPYNGIRSITDYTASAALNTTAKTFGLTLFKPIAKFFQKYHRPGISTPFLNGLPILYAYGDSQPCLFWLIKEAGSTVTSHTVLDIKFIVESS